MKAILIHSENQTISEVEVSADHTLKDWYKYVQTDIVEVAPVFVSEKDQLLVDEEGLMKKIRGSFLYLGSYFVGNGLVVGYNSKGDSISTSQTVEEITRAVVFQP